MRKQTWPTWDLFSVECRCYKLEFFSDFFVPFFLQKSHSSWFTFHANVFLLSSLRSTNFLLECKCDVKMENEENKMFIKFHYTFAQFSALLQMQKLKCCEIFVLFKCKLKWLTFRAFCCSSSEHKLTHACFNSLKSAYNTTMWNVNEWNFIPHHEAISKLFIPHYY